MQKKAWSLVLFLWFLGVENWRAQDKIIKNEISISYAV
jgi:hypothetical protein